jgi:hypothetical protein
MADDGENGKRVPLTGKAVYDQDLYGGDVTGYAPMAVDVEDEEQDERERAVAR